MDEKKSAAMDAMLQHSAKGTTWKKHKYIAIRNGRYIYANGKGKSVTSKYKDPGPFGAEYITNKVDTAKDPMEFVDKAERQYNNDKALDRWYGMKSNIAKNVYRDSEKQIHDVEDTKRQMASAQAAAQRRKSRGQNYISTNQGKISKGLKGLAAKGKNKVKELLAKLSEK